MNRRGFLGMLGKLVAVGVAMGVAPKLMKPVSKFLVVDPRGGGDYTTIQAALDSLPATGGTLFLREGSYAWADITNHWRFRAEGRLP